MSRINFVLAELSMKKFYNLVAMAYLLRLRVVTVQKDG